MNIHFSNVNFSSSSGPNTFACRLAEELSKRGHRIVSADKEYDVFLCFIEPSTIFNGRAKYVHRIDGIWFKPDQFLSHNTKIKKSYEIADHVIWQSNFDKKMTLKYWGQPRSGSVIHNGIKIKKVINEEVHPELLKIREKYDRIFVCSASWHRQKRLKENILLYNSIREDNDALLVLGKNPDYIKNNNNIFYLGHLPHQLCLQVYSIADWFIHLAWLDHCPNVVIEALSQDCPIICTDSGGTSEIVKENGIVIPENTKYDFSLLDYDKPFNIDIDNVKLNMIKVKNDYIKIETVTDMYEETFVK